MKKARLASGLRKLGRNPKCSMECVRWEKLIAQAAHIPFQCRANCVELALHYGNRFENSILWGMFIALPVIALEAVVKVFQRRLVYQSLDESLMIFKEKR